MEQVVIRRVSVRQTNGALHVLNLPARDLLYKYFGQLELLELRFAEIKVSFLW